MQALFGLEILISALIIDWADVVEANVFYLELEYLACLPAYVWSCRLLQYSGSA